MFGLISFDDIWYVLNDEDDPNDSSFFSYERARFIELYKKRPGFFQPYQDGKEFLGGALAPVVHPLEFAALGILGVVVGVISPLVSVGGLIVGLGAAAFGNTKLYDIGLETASTFLYLTGYSLVVTAASLLLAALSIPCALFTLGTRGFASVGAEVLECMNDMQTTSEVQASMLK
ncbi:hypothetical protein [Fluoribacter gormanii]|uniref:Uncharacterized protein n=1 Tax=Fluoribacter gormanii TaxID=464 RepID=A0A377GK20_9GAMM|nr:hypothetical protein [Fluoribacter gormanii]KTD04272.1 hypothetical protein Lgor_1040 [Fluoribacter gormanii]MCW8443362.1 hypothetical protein [Fluoribacter gormanii]SIR74677.1 hypothetical protein SAMN05421777_12240 [Fluoribacter gormanii]STO25098.1 Uncharacterised protein [Fluoribacter gormanii]